jgi:hypothetical protein
MQIPKPLTSSPTYYDTASSVERGKQLKMLGLLNRVKIISNNNIMVLFNLGFDYGR